MHSHTGLKTHQTPSGIHRFSGKIWNSQLIDQQLLTEIGLKKKSHSGFSILAKDTLETRNIETCWVTNDWSHSLICYALGVCKTLMKRQCYMKQ